MVDVRNVDIISVKCKKCGKELSEEWIFCPYCKTSIDEIQCIYCGKMVKAHWQFCPYCAKKISMPSNKFIVEKSNEWLKSILNK